MTCTPVKVFVRWLVWGAFIISTLVKVYMRCKQFDLVQLLSHLLSVATWLTSKVADKVDKMDHNLLTALLKSVRMVLRSQQSRAAPYKPH